MTLLMESESKIRKIKPDSELYPVPNEGNITSREFH
jgi:hypothetical protein